MAVVKVRALMTEEDGAQDGGVGDAARGRA